MEFLNFVKGTVLNAFSILDGDKLFRSMFRMLTCADRLRHHSLTQIIGALRPVDGALSSVTISADCSTLEHYSATISTALTVTIKSR